MSHWTNCTNKSQILSPAYKDRKGDSGHSGPCGCDIVRKTLQGVDVFAEDLKDLVDFCSPSWLFIGYEALGAA